MIPDNGLTRIRQHPGDYRIPAEWEAQGAVAMAWPHAATDWAPRLQAAQGTFAAIISAISQSQPVILLVPDAGTARECSHRFGQHPFPVYPVLADYNDTWLRDSLFITAVRSLSGTGQSPQQPAWLALDFPFTGWGGKFTADLDNELSQHLLQQWGLTQHWQPMPFELEGGAVDLDGAGTVLTTVACLQKRHPYPLPKLEQQLNQQLGTNRVLWLYHGALEGDDTDSHVDMLARFAAPDALVFQSCDEPDYPYFEALEKMHSELQSFRQTNGEPYQLHALPWPDPVRDVDGRRLAASYANFLVINRQVLVPLYECQQDEAALAVLQKAFPDRQITGVPCRSLIWQNGSLHCSTMQIPQRAFKDIEPRLVTS